ncbi:hypothetical protein NHX12_029299 [Muraenolepis orangiensis]|uniref:G-protein coupled receptors family 1 profile domain-containing protein n=1 Tax=Muraenolepis orangiensis TaxID=630683 RepID=A0A9Q0EDF9_9TELE|nr:hypothetical protein NHX12_029299 [Muraenolepis orangiensis]
MTPGPPTQNCSDCSNRAPGPEFNTVKAATLALVLGGIILFGVVGNILVILSVACHRQLRTVTNYFIVNLAAADLLLSAAVLPFSAVFEILGRWVFGRVLCTVWAAVDVLCCTASIMSLCVISVDRYVGVSYPLRYPAIVTERRALWAVVALWALSAVISVGPLFGWKEPPPADETVCRITEEPAYAVFSAVGSFYLPLAVILAMYFRVPSDTVFKVTFWLGYFNSCINPIIYPCSNLEFRKAFQSLLGIRCLRAAPRPPLHPSPVHSQGNAHALALHLDERREPQRLSPSSSAGLSRTPSSRDGREWRGSSGRDWANGPGPVESGGAKVAKLCRKSLRTTCCCVAAGGGPPSSREPRPVTRPPLGKTLPTIKIHQLSLSENGEPV